jgi:PEP-CTERM motif
LYDQDDYNDWRANFGKPDDAASAASAIPEPATLMMLMPFIALIAMAVRKASV